jgi:signal transduction histidine kinase/HD-like signal output (HDOD) protein
MPSHDPERGFVDKVLRRTQIVRFTPFAGAVHGALASTSGAWDAADVASWFALDPVLAARLLGTCADLPETQRSLADGLAARVQGLGPGLIRALLTSAAAVSVRPHGGGPSVVDVSGFWSHSLRAACVARTLAEAAGYADPQEAYLAGLLHDIGMLALAAALPGTCDALLRVDPSADAAAARERAGRFGTIHAQIGAALLEGLHVSAAVCDAVLLHHASAEDLAGTHPMVRIVRSAEAICQKGAACEVGMAVDLLGLSESTVRRSVEEADAAHTLEMQRVQVSADGACAGATADTLLKQHLLGASTCAQGAVQLAGATSFATALEQVGRLLPLVAGVGAGVVFAAEKPGEAPGAWLVGPTGAKRLSIDLLRPDVSGVIAHAFHAGTRVVSHAPPRGIRVVGLDLQTGRALRAEAITALPTRTPGGSCVGVLVVGFRLAGAASISAEVPVLQGLSDALGATLERLAARANDDGGGALEVLRATTRHLVHEARNPLAIIKASVAVARRRAAQGEDISGELDVFAEEIDRVSAIANQIANADEANDAPDRVVHVNRAIRELLIAYEEPLFRDRGLAVELDLAASDPAIVGSARAIKQVLLNLLKNASEAMELGGEIEIATADLLNVEGRMMVEITVADSGPGLAPGAMPSLFEPPAPIAGADGRGFGLANCLRLVKEMGGYLSCRSRPGDGATFAVLLPRVVDARSAPHRRKRYLGA